MLTYVGAYDEKQITAAIRRELLREGQVFFVHNKVSTHREGRRPASASSCPRPGSRPPTARWASTSSSRSSLDFWEKRFDVLVCTTIVETGLDISNANTLIVERADVLGLSQLHQLRGRVGRGRERAYSLLPLPAREADDRDGARPAADHRQQHRPRRRACRWP